MEGFIKIHRKMLHWEWFSEPQTLSVFMYLLLTCNYQEKKWRGIGLGVGEIIQSISTIAQGSGLSVRRVRTALDRLMSTGELTQRRHGKYRILKVENFNSYQLSDKKTTSKRQRNDIETTTAKERKEINNHHNDQNFEKFWIEYPRKVGKKKSHSIWKRMKPNERDKAIAILSEYKRSEQWRKESGRFIPHPSTWLGQGRWEDEIQKNTTSLSVPGLKDWREITNEL